MYISQYGFQLYDSLTHRRGRCVFLWLVVTECCYVSFFLYYDTQWLQGEGGGRDGRRGGRGGGREEIKGERDEEGEVEGEKR